MTPPPPRLGPLDRLLLALLVPRGRRADLEGDLLELRTANAPPASPTRELLRSAPALLAWQVRRRARESDAVALAGVALATSLAVALLSGVAGAPLACIVLVSAGVTVAAASNLADATLLRLATLAAGMTTLLVGQALGAGHLGDSVMFLPLAAGLGGFATPRRCRRSAPRAES